MSFDIALLRKAVDWAKEEDKRKRQTSVYTLRAAGEHTWLQNAWASIELKMGWRKEARELDNYRNSVAVNPLSCGSTGCLAGHICVLAGDDYLVPMSAAPGEVVAVDYVVDSENKVHNIDMRALELLGVKEVGELFSGSNSIETVEAIARRIARDHGEVL